MKASIEKIKTLTKYLSDLQARAGAEPSSKHVKRNSQASLDKYLSTEIARTKARIEQLKASS